MHGGEIVATVIPPAPLDAAAPLSTGAATPVVSTRGTERRFRFELAAHPGSPAEARRTTRARLADWSLCEATGQDAVLVVSELVTNAVVHTASRRVVCELRRGDDVLRVVVHDEGCAADRPGVVRGSGPEDERGRGLLLVESVCAAWGVEEHESGLLVWADLPCRAEREPSVVRPRGDLGWGARPKPGPPEREPEGERESPRPGEPSSLWTAQPVGRPPRGRSLPSAPARPDRSGEGPSR